MNIKNRFPSREQFILTFASIVFPLYSWTTYWVLDYLPSWLKSMTFWETISINAYAYAWTLLDSLVILFVIWLLAVVLPEKWLRENFASKGSLTAWLIFIFAFLYQLKNTNKYDFMTGISPGFVLLMGAAIGFFLLSKVRKINDIVISIADRLTIFLFIYLSVSVISVFIVIYNNFAH